jgi:DNA primase
MIMNQIKLLKTFTNNIVVCYDGDNAGINAMIKAIKLLKNEPDITTSLVRLPDGMDPDEYVLKYGSEKYVEYFESHIESPNDFIYDYYVKNKNLNDLSIVDKVKIDLFNFLKTLNSRVLVESYLNKFSQDSGVSQASLFLDYNSFVKGIKVVEDIDNKSFIKKSEAILPQGYSNEEWNNLMFRLRCELRLFNYAKISKKIALELDSKTERNIPLYQCFDDIHKALWDELINTYYGIYDSYNEGKFLQLLSDQKYYNCVVSDKKTLFNLKETENYNSSDMNLCVDMIFMSKDIPTENPKFNSLNFDDQLNDLNERLKQLKRLNKKRKDLKSR